MVTIADHGLSLRVPSGWEARMWVPDLPPPAINLPVVRLTNDAMPVTRNTYAVEESEKLRRSQVVASLVEFDPSLADVGLYAPQGVPEFGVDDLDPRALQRAQEGRAGLQRFFSVNGTGVQPVRDGAAGFGPGASDAGAPRPAGDAHGRSRRSASEEASP